MRAKDKVNFRNSRCHLGLVEWETQPEDVESVGVNECEMKLNTLTLVLYHRYDVATTTY